MAAMLYPKCQIMWRCLKKNMRMNVGRKLFQVEDSLEEGAGGPSTRIAWWVQVQPRVLNLHRKTPGLHTVATSRTDIMGAFSERGVTLPLPELHPPAIPKELHKHMALVHRKITMVPQWILLSSNQQVGK
jgi:hypothetical protein